MATDYNKVLRKRRQTKRTQSTPVVYVLVDPRDSRIKYVGHTYDMERRYKGHIIEARNRCTDNKRLGWIIELEQEGHVPLMVEIEKTTFELADQRERYWMAILTEMGAPLLNVWWSLREKYTAAS